MMVSEGSKGILAARAKGAFEPQLNIEENTMKKIDIGHQHCILLVSEDSGLLLSKRPQYKDGKWYWGCLCSECATWHTQRLILEKMKQFGIKKLGAPSPDLCRPDDVNHRDWAFLFQVLQEGIKMAEEYMKKGVTPDSLIAQVKW